MTRTMVTAAAVNRDRASTNQPIFSTSPVDTATTSPAATRRVSTEPSTAALRPSSCCTRAAAVIQLVTAARCRKVSPTALPAQASAIRPPASASRSPERSTAAWTATPTQNGSEATEAKCSRPQASAFSWPVSWLRKSHHRNRGPERASGTPGSAYGRSWICMASQGLDQGLRSVRGRRQQTVTGWLRRPPPGNRFFPATTRSRRRPQARPRTPDPEPRASALEHWSFGPRTRIRAPGLGLQASGPDPEPGPRPPNLASRTSASPDRDPGRGRRPVPLGVSPSARPAPPRTAAWPVRPPGCSSARRAAPAPARPAGRGSPPRPPGAPRAVPAASRARRR